MNLPSMATGVALSLLLGLSPALADSHSEQAASAAKEKMEKQTSANQDYLDQLPPMIDRDLFFGDPKISGSQISPDGKYMSFIKPYNDVMNVWVKPIDEPFEEATPVTADDRPVSGYFWSEDSERILYVQDKGGNEDFHIYSVDPDGAVEADSGVPAATDLTPMDGIRAYIYAVPEATPESIIIGLNDRDPALHDVYRLNIRTGDRELLIENEANIAGWTTDLSGTVRLATRQTSDGGTEVLKVADGKLGEVLYTCNWQETCGPMRFHTDGQRVYLQSNKGEDVDLIGLFLMDVDSGETELVEFDPEKQVDLSGAIFSEASDELLATVYTGDRQRIYPKSEKLKKALEFLRAELPDGEISFSPQTSDDRLVKVVVSRDVDPGTVYLYDWQNNTVEKLYETRPELPKDALASMQAIRYEARDGLSIPAYVTLPAVDQKKNLPLVAVIHGGPWARDTWGYDPVHQFLANRGYAVFSPNFRGSTGYGKAFLNAGNNEWGEAMQDDITDGIKHLVEQGTVDPDQVCIMGGSYGGYATLAGLTFTPEVYKCGVDIVGPSNLITLLNSIPPYWGPIRKIFTQRMGDPSTEEGKAQLKAQSPLNSVDRIEDPLLVIQGANDPRVKQAESDQIVVAMREKGLPVEYIVATDEGHGFRGKENRLAMFARVESFLGDHLGGRAQTDMSDDIAARLKDITVDVSSVEMPELATSLDAARTAPLPGVDASRLRTGTVKYESSFNAQGQDMQINTTRTVSMDEMDGQQVVKLEGAAEGPMGSGTDLFILEADSLKPIRREAAQGPATINIDYGSDAVTGAIKAGPQEIPISVELDAPAFGSEGALEAALLGMALAEGYSDTLRVAEAGMQQRVRFFEVAVDGTETVQVPAGSFDTYKVQLKAMDGEGGDQTLWITRESPRMIVKTVGKLPPQMGGAEITSVLTAME